MTRDAYFDNLKFVLITLVVIGHLIEPLYDDPWLQSLYVMIYTFHIPLFVLVSGYFAKQIGTGDYFTKVISKLVIPYLIFETLYSLFDYWLYDRPQLIFSYFTPYWLMWFLFSMVLWKTAMPYMIRIKYAVPLSIVLAIVAGYANDAEYYASVSRTIVFFPFFLAGYYMDRSWITMLQRPMMKTIAVLSLITATIVIAVYSPFVVKEWLYGSFSYESLGHYEWTAGLYRIGVYAVAVIIGGAVMSLIPTRPLGIVSELGSNTLYTYVLHGFIVMALTASGMYDWLGIEVARLLIVPLGLMVTVLLSLSRVRVASAWLVEPGVKRIFKRQSSRTDLG
ncbi:acyltransferase family protein [Paenibacillus campi]|uniref:acyltransferase family protein n=1 Tax=Paenibacillus campi TaxID=3106031 RepID=UPI002AFEC222|nr:acyltransferase family protein [Paenibacillus sp. SGZ-1014]